MSFTKPSLDVSKGRDIFIMESLIRDSRGGEHHQHPTPRLGWRLASPMSLRVVKRGPLLYLRRSILGPPGLSLYGGAFMIRQPGACASESGVGWAWPVSAGETWNFYAVTLCDDSLSQNGLGGATNNMKEETFRHQTIIFAARYQVQTCFTQ